MAGQAGPIAGRFSAAYQGKGEPVSSMVFRLARTAGHPAEMPCRTRLSGSKSPWTTVSLATPLSSGSMSKATVDRELKFARGWLYERLRSYAASADGLS